MDPGTCQTTQLLDAGWEGPSGLEELVNRRLVLSGDGPPHHHGLHDLLPAREGFNGARGNSALAVFLAKLSLGSIMARTALAAVDAKAA